MLLEQEQVARGAVKTDLRGYGEQIFAVKWQAASGKCPEKNGMIFLAGRIVVGMLFLVIFVSELKRFSGAAIY